jgi:hypothetical protein
VCESCQNWDLKYSIVNLRLPDIPSHQGSNRLLTAAGYISGRTSVLTKLYQLLHPSCPKAASSSAGLMTWTSTLFEPLHVLWHHRRLSQHPILHPHHQPALGTGSSASNQIWEAWLRVPFHLLHSPTITIPTLEKAHGSRHGRTTAS